MQPDAAPLLAKIEYRSPALALDHLHGSVELPAAIAAKRMEHVTGHALGLDADQDRVFVYAGAPEASCSPMPPQVRPGAARDRRGSGIQ